MALDDLALEHEALKAQVEQLQREHDALSDNGLDAEHVEHRIKLRHKIAELKAHMAQLKSARRES
jgi:hypothetical protein